MGTDQQKAHSGLNRWATDGGSVVALDEAELNQITLAREPESALLDREHLLWTAIGDGLGKLGYEFSSVEETRDWVVENLLESRILSLADDLEIAEIVRERTAAGPAEPLSETAARLGIELDGLPSEPSTS